MTCNLCSECESFPTQYHYNLYKTVLVCAICYLRRRLVEMVFICVTYDENSKNDVIANESTVIEDSTAT